MSATHTRKIKTCYLIITSDKGLAGALNSGVIRKAEQDMRTRSLSKEDIVILAIGRRGGEYFEARGYNVKVKIQNLGDDVSEKEISQITESIKTFKLAAAKPDEAIADERINDCLIVYQNFISTFEQQPSVRQLVPITKEMIAEMIAGITPCAR